jgi:hypothetical protein
VEPKVLSPGSPELAIYPVQANPSYSFKIPCNVIPLPFVCQAVPFLQVSPTTPAISFCKKSKFPQLFSRAFTWSLLSLATLFFKEIWCFKSYVSFCFCKTYLGGCTPGLVITEEFTANVGSRRVNRHRISKRIYQPT